MTRLMTTLLFGRDRFTGLAAIGIIALFVLGCTCGKNFDLGNIGKNDNTTRRTSDNPFGDDKANKGSSDSDEDSGELPSDSEMKSMVKSTTDSFVNAISTEDFSDIYADSSEDFKNTYTEEQMKDVFKEFIQRKRLVLPILNKAAGMDPTFSPRPAIRTENGLSILVINGSYATKPVPTTFDYEYVKRGGEWKLLVLKVNLK